MRVFAPAQCGGRPPAPQPAARRARRARARLGVPGAGRDARRRPAARLLAAGGRALGLGQERPGRGVPGRRRAQRRDRRASPPSSSTRTGRATRCSAELIAQRPGGPGRQPRARPVDRRGRAADPDRGAARCGASRVVHRFAVGFELALAPTFRDDFRESLLRLVTALSGAGVTVLMTSELEDRYTDLRFSPYGAAFLTDAIIVQRYIEVDSRLRRVMAVVKVRASAHSERTARVQHRRRRHPHRRHAARPGRPARRPADAQAARPARRHRPSRDGA